MRTPRIATSENHVALDQLTARWPMRHGLGVFCGIIAAAGCWLLGNRLTGDLFILIAFAATILSAVVGGMAAGLLTTAVSAAAGYLVLPRIEHGDLHVLLIEGFLISVVGGAFRSARFKSRQRLAANLNLEQRLLEISDDERRRIGHDLHDGLGQHLTGISLLSETMAQQLEAGQTPDRHNVERVTRLVSEAVAITRDLAKSLSPVTLEQDGLLAALEELAENRSSLLGIHCRWDCAELEIPVERSRALHLFRIVQEAVNNSVRHGKAKNVRIVLRRFDQHEILITVTDDGSGLSAKTMVNPGLGLRIMQYRARMLNASLAVERAGSSGGTVVTCRCPIFAEGEKKQNVIDRNVANSGIG